MVLSLRFIQQKKGSEQVALSILSWQSLPTLTFPLEVKQKQSPKIHSSKWLYSLLESYGLCQEQPSYSSAYYSVTEATGSQAFINWLKKFSAGHAVPWMRPMFLPLIFKIMPKIIPTTSQEQDHSDRWSRPHLSTIWKHITSQQNASGRRVGGNRG